jgi:hypothetical protein
MVFMCGFASDKSPVANPGFDLYLSRGLPAYRKGTRLENLHTS